MNTKLIHKDPLVSVICSVYNNADYLEEAIESVLNQTYRQFEFLLINDCSTDRSAEIIQSYKDDRIQYIENERNLGLTKSLNKALEMAKGKYIARFDGDDICMKERLREQVSYLETHPDIDLIGSDATYINEKGEKILEGKTIATHENIVKKLENRNVIFHPSILFKNEKEYRYREKFKYSQDYDLFLSLILMGKKLGNINKFLIKYRVVPNSISFSKTIEQQLFADKARSFYQEKKLTGKDSYDKFSMEEISQLASQTTKTKSVIRALIINNFKLNQTQKTKYYIKQYFKAYGYFNKFLIYYLVIILKLNKAAKRLFNFKERLYNS